MEIAFISANRIKIELDNKKGDIRGRILAYFSNQPSWFIGAMLLGNNIALVVYSIYMEELINLDFINKDLSPTLVLLIQTLISTLFILVFAEFIREAREFRKKLGGGMRQVGVIASMARTALQSRESILEDHVKAKKVYDFLIANLNNEKIESIVYKGTNMIFLNIKNEEDPNKLLDIFYSESINAGLIGEKSIRLVFHKDIIHKDIEKICEKLVYSSSKF